MALTPEGTPYVESSDLVANYPAASLALANRVDLVGVLPFATSAARGTAIPSPTDGQYSYLQDSNTTQFWNGSAWQTAGLTPGLNCITPTSIANSGGTASASGGAVTLTGVTTISLNGVFTATYDNYEIIFRVLGSASDNLSIRMRLSGTDASGANYDYQTFVASSTTLTGLRATGQTSSQIGAIRTAAVEHYVHVSSPALAANTGIFSNVRDVGGGPNAAITISSSRHSLDTAYDGFTLIPASGNMTGTLRVYGYQNS